MDRTRWKRLAGACHNEDDCESIFLTEQGRIAVQGYHLLEVRTAHGEAVVEVSPELLKEAARAVG